ncbi:MAG TPA: NADH-quinone oxidoreductase subunit D [Gemmatimonadales bacterium]|nr:NADH-quinone oxidoreductase subunit D [Gemmatimonadales bacterium]
MTSPHSTDALDTYTLNMGPQHPSTHGVLRMKLTLRGEEIVAAEPVIGYSHRAHEKMAENRTYAQFLPNTSRQDYLSGMIYNFAWVEAVEKMAGIAVPERALVARVILAEFNRISSHLLWIGAFLLDLGAATPFLYAWDDREAILFLLESVTGSRLTYCTGRFGGLSRDLDPGFPERARAVLAKLRGRWDEYVRLIEDNVIFVNRTRGVGVLPVDLCRSYGVTGPSLRGSGVAYDVRKAEPYGAYPRFEFDVPTREEGDVFARYMVRVLEMQQSVRIIEQALAQLPDGPVLLPDSIGVKKRLKLPAGSQYYAVESARGHYGILLVSEGGSEPYRAKFRTPSYPNLAVLTEVMPGNMVADAVAILGSVDLVMPEVDR